MPKEDTEAAVKRAIDKHITENKAVVCNPDLLCQLILTELGFSDEFDHNGWKVRRVLGKDMKGTPRGSKHCYGYIATKGSLTENANPSGGVDVPLDYFKRILDRIDSNYQ